MELDELIALASDAEDRKDWEKAVELFTDCRRLSRSAGIILRLGRAQQHLEHWQEAEDLFLQVRKNDPELNLAPVFLGLLYVQRTDMDEDASYQEAEHWYELALGLKSDAPTLSLLGATKVRLGNLADAESCFRRAILVDDRYEEAYYNLGFLIKKERPDEAIGLFRKAVELDPDYAIAHQALGVRLHHGKDFVGAEFHYRRARDLNGKDVFSHLFLANLLAVTNREDEARAEYEAAIALQPGDEVVAGFYKKFLKGFRSDVK